tara:strand:- start:15065 stop:15607 length:543 start_codon:yes stop_codon:yes gene_type:complete
MSININKKERTMSTQQVESRPRLEAKKTIEEFVRENNITIVNEYSDSNPNMERQNMNHYKVTLKRKYKLQGNHKDTRYGNKSMTIFFSQGYGIKDEPTASGVLECLRMDIMHTNYSNSKDGFNDFCDNFGYSNDSIKAKKGYDASFKIGKKLEKFLHDSHDSNFYTTGNRKLTQLLECEE